MAEHPSERPHLLVAYLESTFEIEQLLGELSEDQLESREAEGEWSVRQIVHHLTDNEVADAMRLRQMLAHDFPPIVPFDEHLFTANASTTTAKSSRRSRPSSRCAPQAAQSSSRLRRRTGYAAGGIRNTTATRSRS